MDLSDLLSLFVHICFFLIFYSVFNTIKDQFAIKVAAAWSFGCFDRRQDLLKTSLSVFLPRKSLQVRVETGGILSCCTLGREGDSHSSSSSFIKKMIVNFIINIHHLTIAIINTQKTFYKHVYRDEEETTEEAIGLSQDRVQLRPHAALRNL